MIRNFLALNTMKVTIFIKVKVKFQLDFTAGMFIALLEPSRLSERLESATPLPGKNRYAEDRTRAGGFVARHANR